MQNVTHQHETLAVIQAQISAQEKELNELRTSAVTVETKPSSDPAVYYKQLCCLTAAYKSLSEAEPLLLANDELLPDLLAIRRTSQTITDTKLAITQCEMSLQEVEKLLQKEKEDIEDTRLIHDEIKSRIHSLEEEIKSHSENPSKFFFQGKVQELERNKDNYESEISNLMLTFNSFIDETLAPMLAVEELGGPVVGQILNVDDEIFESSFNNHGKLKKAKLQKDIRQKRISQTWGNRLPDGEKWDEKSIAAAEMRELSEQLLSNVFHADGSNSNTYVKLQRESAAARFLVRSKVAQYHPKDASQLRLTRFGDEISD